MLNIQQYRASHLKGLTGAKTHVKTDDLKYIPAQILKTKYTLCTRVKVGKQSNCQKTCTGLFFAYMEFFWFKTETTEGLAKANALIDTVLEILPFLIEPLQRAPGPTDVCLNLFHKERGYFTLKMNASIYKDNYQRKARYVLLLLLRTTRCSWNEQPGCVQTLQDRDNAIQHVNFQLSKSS